jgi:phosphate transport system substrate-binding protein
MTPYTLGRSLFLGASLLAAVTVQAQGITGAGASFPAPVYSKWADAYHKATGQEVNYQSVGSGAGIKQIKSKTVDFGASDMPLTDEELSKDGLMQFPTVIGGVVPVVNIKGVKPGEVKLSGALLADIYLGRITKWNDAALKALNKGVALPDSPIAVVRRADGSGTTFIFTNYLSKVSPDCRRLGLVEVVLPGVDRRARQGRLAHHRRHLHPDAQGVGQAGAGCGRAQVLQLGLREG